MEILRRLRWQEGPLVSPQRLWLDASPAQGQGGLRFLGSALEAGGRRSDRAICGRFTGQWVFGEKGLYLSASDGEIIQLGDALLSLHPSGFAPGARALRYQAPEGDFLYLGGLGRCTLPGEQARLPAASLLVLGARWPLVEPEAEAAAVLEELLRQLGQGLAEGSRVELQCRDFFFGLELALELERRHPGDLALAMPGRWATRWQEAGGRLPGEPLGKAALRLRVEGALLPGGCQVKLKTALGAAEFDLRRGCSKAELVAVAKSSGATLALLFGDFRQDWAGALEGVLPCRFLEAPSSRPLFPPEPP